MNGFELHSDEVARIMLAIKDTYNYDLTDLALTSLKYRLGALIKNHLFQSTEELIYRLTNDEAFLEVFLKEISVPETELFRDAQMWRILRFQIIKDLYEKTNEVIRIWVPGITSGEDLYSLAILLKEIYLLDKVQIMVSSISQKYLDQVRSGAFNPKKNEMNLANYLRYKGKTDFSGYYTVHNNVAYWDTKLIEKVIFLPPQSLFFKPPEKIHLVIFRNRMLYFNRNMQNRALNQIYYSLEPEGYLVIGVKETIARSPVTDKFITINEQESIYRKKY